MLDRARTAYAVTRSLYIVQFGRTRTRQDRQLTLDSLIARHGRPSFEKIDAVAISSWPIALPDLANSGDVYARLADGR